MADRTDDDYVTPAQQLYLRAFIRWTRTRSDEDRAAMTTMLAAIRYERGLPVEPVDLADRLVGLALETATSRRRGHLIAARRQLQEALNADG